MGVLWDEHVERVRQGDILRRVDLVEYSRVEREYADVSFVRFPYVVVLTQDCDLQQDDTNRHSEDAGTEDKYLFSALVVPLYVYDQLRVGQHLSELGLTAASLPAPGTGAGGMLLQNSNPRYHVLDLTPFGLPKLVADFKHYFSANVEYLRERKATDLAGSLNELYREDLSQRFAAFLSRIGLPPT